MESTPSILKDKTADKQPADNPVFPNLQNDIQGHILASKQISIELVDCFEALARDLEKTHPATKVYNDASSNTTKYRQSQKANEMNTHKEGPGKKTLKGKPVQKPAHKTEHVEKRAPQRVHKVLHTSTRRGVKRPLEEDESSTKQQRLASNPVQTLTRMRKSPSSSQVIEKTAKFGPQKKAKFLKKKSGNNRFKVRDYSGRPPHEKQPTHPHPIKAEPHQAQRTFQSSSPRRNSSLNLRLQEKRDVEQLQEQQEKGIKNTLKKFLIMGTKVANAISETLKHNEEALLSKSSAFEKKCLNLVHALARQGADLEEDDMEKVLKLLDEEQEERRLYRHTFLESLRVSHLTNMALYNQMLRLLKTL